MKYLFTLCFIVVVSFTAFSQSTFQSTLQTGISLPVNSNAVNSTHAGQGIHFGNSMDYYFGAGKVRFGLGAYVGYLNSLNTDVDYKKIGQALADKYGFAQGILSFKETEFKSTHILLGPVVSFSCKNWNFNLWAKGGFGLNDPGQYAVQYKEGNLVSNIYVNQAGDIKNGLAYNGGLALQYSISPNVGLQFGANYFGTQTDQVNYNYDREKGSSPLYYTAKNNFIQASIGVALKFVNGKEAMRFKTKSNIKNDRAMAGNNEDDNNAYRQINKSMSNVKNNRSVEIEEEEDNPANTIVNKSRSNVKNNRMMNDNIDQLVFTPDKIQIRGTRQTQGMEFGERAVQLNSVNNYLTGFAYQTDDGVSIGQCRSNEMRSDPIPGVDVKLAGNSASGNSIPALVTKTNADGSFSFNNIQPGDYTATVGDDTMNVVVKSDNEDGYKTMDISSGTCSNSIENNVISIDDTMFVEVMPARDASTGMASRRKHLANIKWNDRYISTGDDGIDPATGRIIATTQKHAINTKGTGSNNGTMINNDPDILTTDTNDKIVVPKQQHAINTKGTGSNNGRMINNDPVPGTENAKKHLGNVKYNDFKLVAPRDVATGLATGKRMHKPYKVTDTEFDINQQNIIRYDGKVYAEVVNSREASTGMANGRVLITGDVDGDGFDDNAIVSPRDPASGLATGKRMHKPFVVTKELDIRSNEIGSPRDASTGLPTGRRMHKPFVVTKELDRSSNEIGSSGNSTNNQHLFRKFNKKAEDSYQPWDNESEENTVNNPLYESGGTKGENPLFEAKSTLMVIGSNGVDHDIFIPDNLQVDLNSNTSPVTMQEYKMDPVKWMTSESNALASDKGINEAGMKKGITQSSKGITQSGKGINEAGMKKGINQAGVKKNQVEVRGWDPQNKSGISGGDQKASINTTRSNIKHVSRITCTDGTCTIECVVEMNGHEYDAVITGSFRSLKDSPKSMMNIIR